MYTSSNAFAGNFLGSGCKIFADGIPVGEVKRVSLRPLRQLEILMNWIPEDRGQQYLMAAAQTHFPHAPHLDIEFEIGPGGRKVTWFRCLAMAFSSDIVPNEVADFRIRFSYQDWRATPSFAKHNVEDGPEVDLIERETDIQWDWLGKLIREAFAKEYSRPAGGGFIEILPPGVKWQPTYTAGTATPETAEAARDREVLAQIDGHYCYDWDGLAVSALTPEYDCCVDFPKTLLGRITNWFFMRWFNWQDPCQ